MKPGFEQIESLKDNLITINNFIEIYEENFENLENHSRISITTTFYEKIQDILINMKDIPSWINPLKYVKFQPKESDLVMLREKAMSNKLPLSKFPIFMKYIAKVFPLSYSLVGSISNNRGWWE